MTAKMTANTAAECERELATMDRDARLELRACSPTLLDDSPAVPGAARLRVDFTIQRRQPSRHPTLEGAAVDSKEISTQSQPFLL